MPGGGPAAAAAITEQPPDTVAIMLSAYCADDDLSASLRSRAVEYLLRDTGPEDKLPEAVRAVLESAAG